WPVPSATTFTSMPLACLNCGRMWPKRPDCSVEVVDATTIEGDCAWVVIGSAARRVAVARAARCLRASVWIRGSIGGSPRVLRGGAQGAKDRACTLGGSMASRGQLLVLRDARRPPSDWRNLLTPSDPINMNRNA